MFAVFLFGSHHETVMSPSSSAPKFMLALGFLTPLLVRGPHRPVGAMTETIVNLPTVLIPAAWVRPKAGPPPPTQAVNLPSFETLDRVGRSMIARLTAGVSPHAEAAAWLDWLSHFSRAPGRQLELAALGTVLTARLATLMAGIPVAPSLEPEPI